MKLFKTLLDEFDKILKEKNLPNYEKLAKPLPVIEIDQYFEKLNIRNQDLHLLYEWKNGFDASRPGRCDITDFGPFLSLESMVKYIELNLNEDIWPHTYIPIINDFSGSFIMLNSQSGVNDEKLYLYSPSLLFVEPITYYDSVYAMLETTIESYNRNVFVYNPINDFLDINMIEFRKIGKAINKKSKYWSIESHS